MSQTINPIRFGKLSYFLRFKFTDTGVLIIFTERQETDSK